MMEEKHKAWGRGRRRALKLLGAAGIAAGTFAAGVTSPFDAVAAEGLGAPQPEEKVADTLKRLFGNRALQAGGNRLKLEAPLIAENGAVVPVKVDAELPMTANSYVKNIYIISDKNRRPLNAKFTLTPEAGKASVATNIRLAETTDVRAIAEMSDGALYEAKREVKVTVGGCGG
jgi:sulfur-oxidizing protein SoxY